MGFVREAIGVAVVLCCSAVACGGDSDSDSKGGSGGGAGSSGGSAGSAGSGAGAGGSSGSGGVCMADESYSGKWYGRYETDQALATILSGFAPAIACFQADVVVDADAMTASATGETFPSDGTTVRMYTADIEEGQAVVIPISAREFGVLEITVGCDGAASASLQAGPFSGSCSGMVNPTDGGDLVCEAFGPGGPLGVIDVSITRVAPDPATCTDTVIPPVMGPDCSMLPLSSEVGNACSPACTLMDGGACTDDGQCRALCLSQFTGCGLHCQQNESCLPLEQGGAPVMVNIGGTDYEAGACALESGPQQAYEACGTQRCNGFNCLAFAGANTVGLCTPECFGNDSDCPPGPAGFTPVCALRDQTGRQFCALTCDPTMPDTSCPPDHACLPAGAKPDGVPVCLPTKT